MDICLVINFFYFPKEKQQHYIVLMLFQENITGK